MALLLFALLVIAVLYLVNKYYFSYWSKRNIPSLSNPKPIIGNTGEVLTLKLSLTDFFANIYKEYKKEKVFGAYLSYRPILSINDPELIQDVMIREFSSFHDRSTPGEAAKNYPLVGNLFNLKGQKWRDLRVKLSPTFTTGKLKVMFPTMIECGKVLQNYIEKNIQNGNNVLDFKDLFSRFTINNISSIGFGIDNDCINEPDNIFRTMGLKIFAPTLRNGIINILAFFLPDLFVKLRIDPFEKDLTEFIYSMVNQTIDHREKNNVQRKDFMQLMVQLKNQGYLSPDKDDTVDEDKSQSADKNEVYTKLTVDEIAAQAFIFFGAGFETSSSTMSFCLFELARNPEVQQKAQADIDRVLKAANTTELNYNLLQEMKYLDYCIDETLRKYPIAAILVREASKEFTFPSTNMTIEKGTPVFIPLIGLHRDPEIYDNPLEFIPERFENSPHGNGKAKGLFYLPFGDGPRNCIGSRLGKLQAKLGLALILQKFSFELQDKTLAYGELEFDPKSFVLMPLKTILMKSTKRTSF
jgi:cytochrome P450 family 6